MSEVQRGAYESQDIALVGALYGLDNNIEGGRVAKLPIEFGRPVCAYPGDEKSAYPFLQDAAVLVFDTDFVTGNSIVITVNGVAIDPVAFVTDHATTMNAVLTALNNLEGVDAVLDANDSNNRTFIIRTKGFTAVVLEDVTGGAGQATGTITSTTAQIFVGLAARTDNVTGNYAQYDAVNTLIEGKLWGTVANAVKANVPAYVNTSGVLDASGVLIGGRYFTSAAQNALAVCEVTEKLSLGVAELF